MSCPPRRTPPRRPIFETWPFRSVLLIGLVGCEGARQPEVYPVVGTLTVNGQPAANAMIAFHPTNRVRPQTCLSVATTGQDGRYQLTTYEAGDGAPAGEFAITVVWPDDTRPHDECEDATTHDRFRGRYANPSQSPWRVTVVAGKNEAPLRITQLSDASQTAGEHLREP